MFLLKVNNNKKNKNARKKRIYIQSMNPNPYEKDRLIFVSIKHSAGVV